MDARGTLGTPPVSAWQCPIKPHTRTTTRPERGGPELQHASNAINWDPLVFSEGFSTQRLSQQLIGAQIKVWWIRVRENGINNIKYMQPLIHTTNTLSHNVFTSFVLPHLPWCHATYTLYKSPPNRYTDKKFTGICSNLVPGTDVLSLSTAYSYISMCLSPIHLFCHTSSVFSGSWLDVSCPDLKPLQHINVWPCHILSLMCLSLHR